MEILYLRSTVKKINNQAIRVPHLAKPQNVVFKLMKDNTQKEYQEVKDKLLSELKGLTYRQAKRILDDLQLTIQLKSVVQ